MSDTWIHNNSVDTAIVTVDGRGYIVYVKKVSARLPVLIEDVETRKRITYTEVRDELKQGLNLDVDEITRYMINKLKNKPS